MGKLKDYYQQLKEEPTDDDYDCIFLEVIEQDYLEKQEMLVSYFMALEELKDF
jgi:hypothetical protein